MLILREGELSVDYLDVCAGPAVVLAYSSVSANQQRRRLVAALRPTYRCAAPNLLGYGPTSPWQAGRKQTLADKVQVTLALCKTIPGPIQLVGHSWGCVVAFETANKLKNSVCCVTAADVAHANKKDSVILHQNNALCSVAAADDCRSMAANGIMKSILAGGLATSHS